jgi:hypothetical protein
MFTISKYTSFFGISEIYRQWITPPFGDAGPRTETDIFFGRGVSNPKFPCRFFGVLVVTNGYG